MEFAIRMHRKWMSICTSALSALAMHCAFATIVHMWFSASVFLIIVMIVGTLFIWMICGGWCRRRLGLSPSPPTFVFSNVFFLWGVYIFLIRRDVGPAMDAAFNTQCLILTVGLWRMLVSDPGYVRYENTFAESMDQTIFLETKTDQLGVVDHFSGTIENSETASGYLYEQDIVESVEPMLIDLIIIALQLETVWVRETIGSLSYCL